MLTLGDPVAYISVVSSTWPVLALLFIGPAVYIFSGSFYITRWSCMLLAFDKAVVIAGSSMALFVQDLDAGVRWRSMVWHQVLSLICYPLVKALSCVSLISAWTDIPRGFDVIAK